MNRHFVRTILACTAMSAVLLLASACSHTPLGERYQPGADTISLWQNEPIPLEPGWRYLGEERVGVRGKILDSSLIPTDEVRSLLFVRENGQAPEFLILSRVIKANQVEIFRYLGGTKTDIEGFPYREALYGLSADTADPEYRRYFESIRTAGISPAPAYIVRVLDRLPVDTALVRIMELTPGDRHPSLPAFGNLYPQERLEPFHQRFF